MSTFSAKKPSDGIQAVVQQIIRDGKHGPFVVTTTEAKDIEGSITFPLNKGSWLEDREPEPGEAVFLTSLSKKRGGWRANKARFTTPADTATSNEDRATSKNGSTRNTVAFFVTQEFASLEVEKNWMAWIDTKKRTADDLKDIVLGDFLEAYKKHALFSLLQPEGSIAWGAGIHPEFLKKIPPNLYSFASEVIVRSMDDIAESPCIRGEESFNLSNEYLWVYNSCIWNLVPLLPENEQEPLLERFLINDPQKNGIEAYELFQELMLWNHDPLLNKLRTVADMKARKILLAEIKNGFKRTSYKNFLWRYGEIVQMSVRARHSVHFDKELFANQLSFVVKHSPTDWSIITMGNILEIEDALNDPKYDEVLYQVVCYVASRDGFEDGVSFKGYLRVMRLIRRRIAQRNERIAKRIQTAIEKSKILIAERTQWEEMQKKMEVLCAIKEAEDAVKDAQILSKMKA